MGAHTCNSNTQGAEAGELPIIQHPLGLYREYRDTFSKIKQDHCSNIKQAQNIAYRLWDILEMEYNAIKGKTTSVDRCYSDFSFIQCHI